jgi:hypothetical protein
VSERRPCEREEACERGTTKPNRCPSWLLARECEGRRGSGRWLAYRSEEAVCCSLLASMSTTTSSEGSYGMDIIASTHEFIACAVDALCTACAEAVESLSPFHNSWLRSLPVHTHTAHGSHIPPACDQMKRTSPVSAEPRL